MKPLKLIIMLSILSIILLGCTGVTGNAIRPPPPTAPSGGGCGVAAPPEVLTQPLQPTETTAF